MTPAAERHDGGLRAFIHAGQRQDEPPADLAAITCWADADAELDHLAGCYCAVASDLPRPLMAAEACTELGAGTAPPRLSLWRRLAVHFLERRLAIVIDERDRYEEAGLIGPQYHFNSLQQQFALMGRIRHLKGLPPAYDTEARP